MFYIISREYVGPDCGSADHHVRIRISDEPARQSDGAPVTDGLVGEYDGWCVWAHGAYPTVQAARDAVPYLFFKLREIDADAAYLPVWHGRIRKHPRPLPQQ